MPNTHRRRRRDSTVELRRVGVGGVNRIRNYSSRRLPTDSVDSLETDQTDRGLTTWILIDINQSINLFAKYDNYDMILITFSTTTSLCRHFVNQPQ